MVSVVVFWTGDASVHRTDAMRQFRRAGCCHFHTTTHAGHLFGQIPEVLFGATDHVSSESVDEEENTHSGVILGQEGRNAQEKSNRRRNLGNLEIPRRRVGLDFAAGQCVG
jgi:hypothetical protein